MIFFWTGVILMTGIMVSSFYVFMKSIRYVATAKHQLLAITWSLAWAMLFAISPDFLPLPFFRPIMCIATIFFIVGATEQAPKIVTAAYLLAFGIAYALYYISALTVFVIYDFLTNQENVAAEFDSFFYIILYTIIFILQFSLSVLLLRIRRFRNGFPFIFRKLTIVFVLMFTGMILIFATWIHTSAVSDEIFTAYLYLAGTLIAGIGAYVWVRRLIRVVQKSRMQQNREAHLEKLIEEKDIELQGLGEKFFELKTIVHMFTARIEAMEAAFDKGESSLEDAQKLQGDFQAALSKIKGTKVLPSTNVNAIDHLFSYFAGKLTSEDIAFRLLVSGSVVYMVEHVIERGKLETLIADHLKDAQIAVNASDGSFRSVMVAIGIVDNCYEFTVFDSGIPFTVDTLERLGIEHVTTHADSGGSGIGFMTTFKTMRECGASLIISEQEPSATDYSKSVTIRFDQKNKYIIKTYRPDAFTKSDRYTVLGNEREIT